MSNVPDLAKLLAFAVALADEARVLMHDDLTRRSAVERKCDGSLVTALDRRVEARLRKLIRRIYPEHGIVGEESGLTPGSSDYLWILDPIDGTEELARGLPTFGTIIGLHRAGVPVVGVIDSAALDMRLAAASTMGVTLNSEPIHAREPLVQRPPLVVLPAFEDFADVAAGPQIYLRLITIFPNFRVLRSCFGHILAVTGAADAALEYGVDIWDLAATRLLVEEAGGVFIMIDEFCGDDGRRRYVAAFGRKEIAQALVDIVTGQPS